MGRHTLQDLRGVAKDIVDDHDCLIRVLGASDIGLVSVDLLVRSLGRVLGLDGWEFTACSICQLGLCGSGLLDLPDDIFVVCV
jgi:hypothetical protein